MFAVISSGGKQYKVSPGDIVRVERLNLQVGSRLKPQVLSVCQQGNLVLDKLSLSGLEIAAEVIEHGRGEKITVFKKKRRKNYRRKQGHRQHYTALKIIFESEVADNPKSPAGDGFRSCDDSQTPARPINFNQQGDDTGSFPEIP